MSDIVWGEPIEVNGVRPEWLCGRQIVDLRTLMGWRNSHGKPEEVLDTWSWMHSYGDPCITAIRLPAPHPYYTVQRYNAEHGTSFVYWPGGDDAPADWDGGEVLRRDGEHHRPVQWVAPYEHNQRWFWSDFMPFADIIGYTRLTEPASAGKATDDSDYVRVKRMTGGEWRYLWFDYGATELGAYLGIIKPEPTEAERIAAKTGLTPEQVQVVLDAQNA